MSGQCIAVVSGKGGTGKTSLTAGVGEALALMGHRVLCIDCDAGLRNLDLALGLTDRALMDFSDVVVHVFTDEARKFYDLERLWTDAQEIDLTEVLKPE